MLIVLFVNKNKSPYNLPKIFLVWCRKYGLEDDTIDFIGHALALYPDDSYLDQPAIDFVKRMKVKSNIMDFYICIELFLFFRITCSSCQWKAQSAHRSLVLSLARLICMYSICHAPFHLTLHCLRPDAIIEEFAWLCRMLYAILLVLLMFMQYECLFRIFIIC